MEIKGKLAVIMNEVQVTESFKKREFVVEYADNPQYPELVKFEMIQDKCSDLDKFNVGQEIVVHFNLKGRKWTDPRGVDKYFNTLHAWKVLESNTAQGTQQSAAASSPEIGGGDSMPEWLANSDNGEGGDLPF